MTASFAPCYTRRRTGTVILSAVLVAALVGSAGAVAFAAQKNRQPVAPASTTSTAVAPSTDGVAGPIAADRLPEKVTAMREAIMAAARSGDIEALKLPLEWNELKPEFSSGPVPDPIAYWKSLSGDGGGRQILAILLAILEQPFAVVDAKSPRARYVWPEFAEVDPTKLSPAQEVQVYRLVSPADLKAMRARKTWTWYRLSIGADGTWHSFLKTE